MNDKPYNPSIPTAPTTTSPVVVIIVVCALAVVTFTGLIGTIYLCHTSNDPLLVATAAKMIQTDPSSAMAALMLLRADAAVIAIVSGITGVALGQLGSFLNNARTQFAKPSQPSGTQNVKIEQPTDEPIPVTETEKTLPNQ